MTAAASRTSWSTACCADRASTPSRCAVRRWGAGRGRGWPHSIVHVARGKRPGGHAVALRSTRPPCAVAAARPVTSGMQPPQGLFEGRALPGLRRACHATPLPGSKRPLHARMRGCTIPLRAACWAAGAVCGADEVVAQHLPQRLHLPRPHMLPRRIHQPAGRPACMARRLSTGNLCSHSRSHSHIYAHAAVASAALSSHARTHGRQALCMYASATCGTQRLHMAPCGPMSIPPLS